MRSAECGKCGVWKTRSVENGSVENAECENEECGKRGVWKTRSVESLV